MTLYKKKCKDCPYWKECEDAMAKLRLRQEQIILRENNCYKLEQNLEKRKNEKI